MNRIRKFLNGASDDVIDAIKPAMDMHKDAIQMINKFHKEMSAKNYSVNVKDRDIDIIYNNKTYDIYGYLYKLLLGDIFDEEQAYKHFHWMGERSVIDQFRAIDIKNIIKKDNTIKGIRDAIFFNYFDYIEHITFTPAKSALSTKVRSNYTINNNSNFQLCVELFTGITFVGKQIEFDNKFDSIAFVEKINKARDKYEKLKEGQNDGNA